MTIRPKRRGQRLWNWTERIHIPVPLKLKASVLREARDSRVSVSAWGYGIVVAALENPAWLAAGMEVLERLELEAAARIKKSMR